MNENYNQIYDEGKSISVSGLCAYILKKWKVMLVVALVAAIAGGGMSYVSSYKAYQAAANSVGTPTEPAISAYDKEVVLAKMEMMEACEKSISEYEYYHANSIKSRLDPNDVPQGTITYVISGIKTEDVVEAVSFIEGELLTAENYETIGAQLSEPATEAMLREVAWMTANYEYMSDAADGEVSQTALVKFVVRHFNYEDCEEMLGFFEEKMAKCQENLIAENGAIEMEKISSVMITCCDRSLATLTKDIRNGKLSSYETISNLKKNMSEEQLAYYEYLTKLEAQAEAGETNVTAANAEKPSVNVVMVILAAAAGAACVAVLYAVLYMFGGRVNNKEELKSWLGIPVLGFEAGAEMTAAILEGVAAQAGAKQIYLTGSSEKLNTESILQLKTLLAAKDMEVTAGNSILKDAKALQDAGSCGFVVLVEKCNVSKEKDIREVVMKASSCGIRVLGVVLEK